MFESTLTLGGHSRAHLSTLLRGLPEDWEHTERAATSMPGALSPSLLDDLRRFNRDGVQGELLEVMAASLRHCQDLRVQLEYGRRRFSLTLFPAHRLVLSPLPLPALLCLRLPELFVWGVEPAIALPPGDDGQLQPGAGLAHLGSLDLLSWELALRGARGELLPEVPAFAAYRIPPGIALQGRGIQGPMAAAVHRLKRQSVNLRELSGWSGFDRERAMRLLNALYLQSALMVSRSHPAAQAETR
jgi:hypothetical protein